MIAKMAKMVALRGRNETYLSILLSLWIVLLPLVNTVKIAKESEFKWVISNHEYVLAYFYDDSCTSASCIASDAQFETLVEESSHSFSRLEVIKISSPTLNSAYGISSVPKLVFFRKSYPVIYTGDLGDIEEVTMWMESNRDISTRSLYDDDFEHLTQACSGSTTGDWFIWFYTPECDTLLGIWESVASRLKHRMNVAKVDIDANQRIRERFNIRSCPAIIFFRLGKMYEYSLKERDYESLVSFAEGWYKNVNGKRVPAEPTPFDNLVDYIVATLKSYHEQPYGPGALGFLCLLIFSVGLLCVCCCLSPGKREKTD